MLCKPHFHLRDGRSYRASPSSYTPPQVARAYGIPPDLDGTGQTVGIVELGGAFSQTDLTSYLSSLGLPDVKVVVVNVAGGSQHAGPSGADVEVMLDVCIVAALCPRASVRVYFAPNTDQGFAQSVAQAIQDGCDSISISWGAPEGRWSAQGRQAMDNVLEMAISRGVNIFAAAGDNGSGDGLTGDNVDYPASSPYSVGCGGTALHLDPSGKILSETVWNDGSRGGATGGGFSTLYPRPDFQKASTTKTSRGVPDVSGVADPETGWIIRANGHDTSVGGTSAVAPFWAAVSALLNQKVGKRTGWLPTILYQHPEVFRDTITGSNGDYQAGPGWDACTGLGSPDGMKLFALMGVPTPTPVPVPIPVPVPTPTPVFVGEIGLRANLKPGWYSLVPTQPGNRRYPAVLQVVVAPPAGNYNLVAKAPALLATELASLQTYLVGFEGGGAYVLPVEAECT